MSQCHFHSRCFHIAANNLYSYLGLLPESQRVESSVCDPSFDSQSFEIMLPPAFCLEVENLHLTAKYGLWLLFDLVSAKNIVAHFRSVVSIQSWV